MIVNRRPYAPPIHGHSGQHIDCPLCRAHQRAAFQYAARNVEDAIEETSAGYRLVFFVNGHMIPNPQQLPDYL